METESISQETVRRITVEGNSGAYCKCGEGYTCVITRTEGPDAGKAFKSGENSTCITDGTGEVDSDQQHNVVTIDGGKAYCKCGEGWTCVISKIDGPDAGKPATECAEGCTCATDV